MATVIKPLLIVMESITQTQENTIASALSGQPAGSMILYNETISQVRLWNGSVFENPPFNTLYAAALTADENYVTDTEKIKLGNLSGTNTGDQTSVSGNSGTASTLQNTRLINGQSFNGSADINVDDLIAYQALGSPILAQTVGQRLEYSNVSTNMVDGQIKFTAVYLPKAATLTGIKVYVRVLGNYTPDNNNRIGLYSYSGGNLTLVASSSNNGTLWTSAANAVQTIPFSTPYAAVAGIYYVGILYNQSAVVTAPALASGVALNNLVMGSTVYGFTNSAKLHGTANGTDLTTPIAMSAITSSVIPTWVALY